MRGTGLGFENKCISSAPDAVAPDGSEVRVLCQATRGGLAVFTLPPRAIAKPVAHRTVEEVWYILSGSGRLWRKLGEQEEIIDLNPGISLTIPTGTHFQFRCDGDERLDVIGATMPPWPGESEAYFVEGVLAAYGVTRCGSDGHPSSSLDRLRRSAATTESTSL